MQGRQRIIPVRRDYNRWVANETLEDFALRFTAKRARRWSVLRVAQTALGSVAFLALEAIGGTLILAYGFTNTMAAILAVGLVIFLAGVPVGATAARHGLDVDLLTRGAGFGYIGSTLTSLIYASFTYLFFAIEAAIMALALELCLGLPLPVGYLVSALAVIPLVTYGIALISRFQLVTQPVWLLLNLLPLAFIAVAADRPVEAWMAHAGLAGARGEGFDPLLFGAACGILFSLLAQVGEQVDFLRFVPPPQPNRELRWWAAVLGAGAGWVVPGMLKILLGSFLAVLALGQGVPAERASEPTQMYAAAFGYGLPAGGAILVTGLFVVISQLKINVTNAYAGSIAWSNFFSRLTHSHPGRVVWLVFNVAIALLLMELGIYKTLERTLGLYALVAAAWMGALMADLAVNKPLGLSPPGIEFKRAHLYDVNPVGTGAMALACLVAFLAYAGLLGAGPQAFAAFIALGTAFAAAPLIAWATDGRYYFARRPRRHWQRRGEITCGVCEHSFEPEDMAYCPAYAVPICSLCCSLDVRCGDLCKPHARLSAQVSHVAARLSPRVAAVVESRLGRYAGIMLALCAAAGLILGVVYAEAAHRAPAHGAVLAQALEAVFFVMAVIFGVVAWLFVLAQESRRVAQEETARQTALHRAEIAAHKITDAKLQKAKEAAEAANLAKSRYVVGISHELRTPLNAVLGYAQLLENDPAIPPQRQSGIRVIRRSAEHLSGLIDGLLDISRMEAGRLQLHRNAVRLPDFLDQIVDMCRPQAEAAGLEFRFTRPAILPALVATDEKRLRQILLNLISNAIKFTARGHVGLDLTYRNQIAEFAVTDTGSGIPEADLPRIFEPFVRGTLPAATSTPGTGLGLTIAHLLAQVMGGEITVASALGRGSTFRLRLMLSSLAESGRAAPAEAPVRGYAGRRRTIFVVDDDPAHRDLMREILTPLGFTLLSAADGPSCLDLAAGCRPDLFLLDIAMPGMNGWELARRLRAEGHGPARIAMMSANVHEISPVRGEDAPHDAIIAKPFDLRDFLSRIQALLGLDWITAEAPPVRTGPRRATPEQVAELIRLGRIGHVRGIEAKLAEIEAETPAPFVAELRGLVQAYDLPRYMAVLEGMSGDA
ncbi:integral membrane sensor hybrid histidine kinase [Methylobacterium sp. 4-46]|uniref:ATP-binding protein n=1 Tax=unclassified Methylobacterium TaxID=2615210 RepID=UPI000165CA8F|nr:MULTISPECIES: ATP-binding protein [Methylobacterium]ACA15153.1 integral membrane sensor hybrid histidine kinase [Methylobacterium sp. 4-46]WFT80887.1 ATP-binding protein [Methylobacterium nodulans]